MKILKVRQRTSLHLVITFLLSQTSRQQSKELRWDLVAMGEVELVAIVVDMDKFWAQEEMVGEFASCGCS